MKLYIICPGPTKPKDYHKPFSNVFDDTFAQRLLRHLADDSELCTGCGAKCTHCRLSYKLNFSSEIVGVLKLPAALRYYVDDPEKYLPPRLPAHDVLIGVNVHQDILMALPPLAKKSGAKALIVPVEDPDWLDGGTRSRMRKLCQKLALESAFPKPFCSLEEDASHPYINEFIRHFRIGKPKLRLTIREGVIRAAKVLRSAPCGNTYYVAYNLRGAKADNKINEVVAKYWHSYPCVASMKMDYELRDTILHKGGFNHYDAVHEAIEEALIRKPTKEAIRNAQQISKFKA